MDARAQSADEAFPIERIDGDHHRVVIEAHPADPPDVPAFGGFVLGAAARAAGRSCPDRPVASLHMLFLRPVPVGVPVDLRVERVRDGRRVAHRSVGVHAGGKLCAEMRTTHATPEPDRLDLVGSRPVDDLPRPEELPSAEEVARQEGWDGWGTDPLEWRWVGRPWDVPAGTAEPYHAWVRPRRPIADEPGLQAALVAFFSDYHSHWPVARLVGGRYEPVGFASLDTAIWFHRDVAWDDWWLITSRCDVGHGGRAFSRRQVHGRDGRLVATMAQEALIPD